jgi:hypothetical protein
MLVLSAGLLTLAACNDSTGPDQSLFQITSASALLNGTPIAGPIRPDHGDQLRFEARVTPVGPAVLDHVVLEHWARGVKGRKVRLGSTNLYDDGTHGDRIAGDGLYSHEAEFFELMLFMGGDMHRMTGSHDFSIYAVSSDGSSSDAYPIHITVE